MRTATNGNQAKKAAQPTNTKVSEREHITDPGEMHEFLTGHETRIGERGIKMAWIPKEDGIQNTAQLISKLRKSNVLRIDDSRVSQAVVIAALDGKYAKRETGFEVVLCKTCPGSILSIEHLRSLQSIFV
ncbi:MAG: hypothetical protein WC045_00515 [Patescibacteria group bacterium]